jgi:transcriptional regulator with GAF, ATPase, and Fis domain
MKVDWILPRRPFAAGRLSRDGLGRPREATPGSVRFVILAAGVFSIAYAAAVLYSVAATGDIGLRCVFGRRVFEIGPEEYWSSDPSKRVTDPALQAPRAASDRLSRVPPLAGDTLLHIGPWSIDNYHNYVQAKRVISKREGDSVEVRWTDSAGSNYLGQVRIHKAPVGSYSWSLIWFVLELSVFGIGARVYWNRPRDETARIFFWLCVATVVAFIGGYHWPQIVIQPVLIYLFTLSAVFVPILSLHFYLVFPRVNPVFARYHRPLALVLYGVPLVSVVAMWVSMSWSAHDPDPRHVDMALRALQTIAIGYVRLSVALMFVCLGILVYSFFRARSRWERNQVRWILLASLLSVFPIGFLMWDTWNAPYRLGLSSSVWPMFLVSLLYTTAYAVSITRYKLMRAEEYLNRGVVYVLVSVSAGLLYSGVLVVVTLAIGDRILAGRTSVGALVAGVTAIVVLVLSEMGRQGFQRVLDRQFYREKYNFDQAMRRMSQAVGNLVDRETLGRRLLEAAADVLRVEWGAIYVAELDEASGLLLAAGYGTEPDERVLAADNPLVVQLRQSRRPLRVGHGLTVNSDPAADAMIRLGGEIAAPLQTDGTLAGLLILGPKRSGMPYDDDEVAFLAALGSVGTLALRSSDIQATLESLNRDLRDKVDKIAEQRRRIGILQDQLARRAASDDPEAPHLALDSPLASEPLPDEPDAFDRIKGTSRAVRRMVETARKVAASNAAVLIGGESGTGKELLAEAIHRAGPRADRPFVKVHCAALSQNLLESELFGHVKGAFTGADRDRIGRFQQADGGTLFLDEIGDINLEVQTKLLRVLQQKSFERVGSSQTISVDVRIIAATHRDLEALIRAGRFREDLFYRLNVIPLSTPPLRERRDDVFELALEFLNEHARHAGRPAYQLEDAAVEALTAYDWPGNIRELQNAIERAVVLADGGVIRTEDLPADVVRPLRKRRTRPLPQLAIAGSVRPEPQTRAGSSPSQAPIDPGDETPLDPEFEAYERSRLLDALRDAGGNKSHAARLLAMPRSTFFSKLKKHGLA